MAVANASMYDGATALAEAGALASGATKRSRLLVSRAVHPEARANSCARPPKGLNLEVVEVGYVNGVTDLDELASQAQRSNRSRNRPIAEFLRLPGGYRCDRADHSRRRRHCSW